MDNLWHVVLISFAPHTPYKIKLMILRRLQTLGSDCGGEDAGILLWIARLNLDQRKGVQLVEIAVFENNAALQAFRCHPMHKKFTDMLREVADWQVGDITHDFPVS